MSYIVWVFLGLAVVVILKAVADSRPGPVMICMTCGHEGPVVKKVRGSFAIEVVLWLCLLVPGIVYSLWRLTTKHAACASCAGTQVVPPDTPMGQEMRKRAQQATKAD